MKKTSLLLLSVIFMLSCIFAMSCEISYGEEETYKITFDLQATDVSMAPATYSAGEKLKTPATPVREGYAFVGWFMGDDEFAFSGKMPAVDITVKAEWVKTYQISFQTEYDAGTKTVGQTKAEGDSLQLPVLEQDGYVFNGWTENGVAFTSQIMPSRNLNLVASWTKTYNITFEIGNDTEVKEFGVGAEIVFPYVANDGEAVFVGWERNGQAYKNTIMPNEDLTLVATWQEPVTITFDTRVSGLSVSPIVALPGTAIEKPTSPIRSGYKLVAWQLNNRDYTFSTMPKNDITLVAVWEETGFTSLPAVFIDLTDNSGKEIHINNVTRETYVNAVVSIENTTNENLLAECQAQFKGRGNGSWSGDKKGYRIKFDEKQSVLGNPESRHWVINSGKSNGGFTDPLMLRNYIAYTLADDVFDDIGYVTSAEFVDMYFNGEYWGVYLMLEQVREANDRVDVDTEYGVLDTGYLLEYDAYAPNDGAIEGIDYFRTSEKTNVLPNLTKLHPFTVKSPDPDDYEKEGLTEQQFRQQISYIQAETQKLIDAILENNYTKFCQLADEDSFVDMYILHEYLKNTDTGFSSFYIGKNAGGEFFCTAPWDFDASLGLSRGSSGAGEIYVADTVRNYGYDYNSWATASSIFIKLYSNSSFKSDVVARWKVLSPKIEVFVATTLSDNALEKLKTPMGKNYRRWESPNRDQASAEARWVERVKEEVRDWLFDRIDWLNGEWA